jgi:hypothetical protein
MNLPNHLARIRVEANTFATPAALCADPTYRQPPNSVGVELKCERLPAKGPDCWPS